MIAARMIGALALILALAAPARAEEMRARLLDGPSEHARFSIQVPAMARIETFRDAATDPRHPRVSHVIREDGREIAIVAVTAPELSEPVYWLDAAIASKDYALPPSYAAVAGNGGLEGRASSETATVARERPIWASLSAYRNGDAVVLVSIETTRGAAARDELASAMTQSLRFERPEPRDYSAPVSVRTPGRTLALRASANWEVEAKTSPPATSIMFSHGDPQNHDGLIRLIVQPPKEGDLHERVVAFIERVRVATGVFAQPLREVATDGSELRGARLDAKMFRFEGATKEGNAIVFLMAAMNRGDVDIFALAAAPNMRASDLFAPIPVYATTMSTFDTLLRSADAALAAK